MSLTLEAQQRLESVNLKRFYSGRPVPWDVLAKHAYEFVQKNFPGGAIRVDDVAKALVPVLEVSKELRKELDSKKLKQKYWIRDFADLILDTARKQSWWT